MGLLVLSSFRIIIIAFMKCLPGSMLCTLLGFAHFVLIKIPILQMKKGSKPKSHRAQGHVAKKRWARIQIWLPVSRADLSPLSSTAQ